MSNLTQLINGNNVDNVRSMILKKQSSCPFYATSKDASSIVTDFDHFPYTRFYRGIAWSQNPIVLEREAGYRPRHDECYRVKNCQGYEIDYPETCFQVACSTLFPCNLQNTSNTPEAIGLSPFIKCVSLYR
jgi:hypothetical protein